VHWISLLAQAQGKGGGSPVPGCGGGGLQQFALMGLMFVIFYFLLIRPQQKKAKDHRDMLGSLKRGDRIITNGGLIGKITGLTDKYVTLELAEKIRVRMLRTHILGRESDASEVSSEANG